MPDVPLPAISSALVRFESVLAFLGHIFNCAFGGGAVSVLHFAFTASFFIPCQVHWNISKQIAHPRTSTASCFYDHAFPEKRAARIGRPPHAVQHITASSARSLRPTSPSAPSVSRQSRRTSAPVPSSAGTILDRGLSGLRTPVLPKTALPSRRGSR